MTPVAMRHISFLKHWVGSTQIYALLKTSYTHTTRLRLNTEMLLSNFQCSLAAFLPDIFFSATLGCEVTSAGPGCSFKDRSFFTKTCDIRLLPTSAANTVVQRKESSFIFSPVHRPWHAITLPQLHTTQPVHVCVCASVSHFSTPWESLSRDLEF